MALCEHDENTEAAMEIGYQKTLTGISFEEAITRTTEVLAARGFGIITTIDVKATMKKKIDEDMRPYTILGACNPGFAFKAISHDPEIGLLLPCNVIVHELEDGDIRVSFVRPREMFKLVDEPDFEALMAEVDCGYEEIGDLPWTEIDFPADLDRAASDVLPAIDASL